MPTLLPELAEALAESNRWAAGLIDAELAAEQVRHRAPGSPALPTFDRRLARLAAANSAEAIAEAEELAEIWSAVIRGLRELSPADQLTTLEEFGKVIDTFQQRLAATVRLVETAAAASESSNNVERLASVADRMRRMRTEITKAIDARTNPWQPKDPERFAEAMRANRERKILTPDEVRAYFRAKRE